MTTDTDLIRKNNQEGLQVGDFKVGDRVRVVRREDYSHGKEGVVVGINEFWVMPILVAFGAEDVRYGSDELELIDTPAPDIVAHPPHYVSHPSGIECIQITEHMGFNLGNAVKYIWRCDLKQDAIEDLKKARWYIEREIAKREAA